MRRRSFIKSGFAATLPIAMPGLLTDLFRQKDIVRNLVLIQLAGGNDGYNTLVPYSKENYYLQRPSLAIAKDEVIQLTASYGLNPALKPLLSHYHDGDLLFITATGFEKPERSHYQASQQWEEALLRTKDKRQQFHESPDRDLGANLTSITAQISQTNQQQVFSLKLDGFDTHQFQRDKHDILLKEYSEALHLFIEDLKKNNTFSDTLIITWSEFGRTLKQNTQKGTHHGHENMVLLAGGSLKETGVLDARLYPQDVYSARFISGPDLPSDRI